jgi:hypothetical protein
MQPRVFRFLDRIPGHIDILHVDAGQPGDFARPDFFGNQPHGFEVALRGHGEAGLDNVNAHAGQRPGHPHFLADVHAGSGRLFAVPKRGVKNVNLFRHVTILLISPLAEPYIKKAPPIQAGLFISLGFFRRVCLQTSPPLGQSQAQQQSQGGLKHFGFHLHIP